MRHSMAITAVVVDEDNHEIYEDVTVRRYWRILFSSFWAWAITDICRKIEEHELSFEACIISLALAGSQGDVNPGVGYPPLQSQHAYDLFDEVLFSSPPKIKTKSRIAK